MGMLVAEQNNWQPNELVRARLELAVAAQPGLAELVELLTGLAPETYFCPPQGVESDLERILARGVLWTPAAKAIKLMQGRRSQCHHNAALCWNANRELCRIATGYALSDDFLWRQHTWLVRNFGKKGIVETTEKRLAYYGFIMTPEECQEFYWDNL